MKLKFLFAICISTIFATPALADEVGPYFSGGFGWFGLEADSSAIGYSQKSSTYGALVAGGVHVTPYLDIEARVGSTGTATDTTSSTLWTGQSSSIQSHLFYGAYAKPRLEIDENISLYALAGMTSAKYRLTLPNAGAFDASKSGFSYGAGLSIVGSGTSLSLEWVQYWKNVSITPGYRGSIWGLTALTTIDF